VYVVMNLLRKVIQSIKRRSAPGARVLDLSLQYSYFLGMLPVSRLAFRNFAARLDRLASCGSTSSPVSRRLVGVAVLSCTSAGSECPLQPFPVYEASSASKEPICGDEAALCEGVVAWRVSCWSVAGKLLG